MAGDTRSKKANSIRKANKEARRRFLRSWGYIGNGDSDPNTSRIVNRRIKIRMKELEGCKDCSCHDGRVLQFHHLDPKEKVRGAIQKHSWLGFLKEIEKCIVLCGNCHTIRHCENLLA